MWNWYPFTSLQSKGAGGHVDAFSNARRSGGLIQLSIVGFVIGANRGVVYSTRWNCY